MKVLSSQLPSEWLSVYFGSQYHLLRDPKFKADVPWDDKRVRQAMNMVVNRIELQDNLFKDKGPLIYVSGFAPHLEGWNPEWAQGFDSLDPKVVSEWAYPSQGAGRTTHFDLIMAAQ